MGERRVSIIIGSGCGTAWVHQKLLIQLSADDEWIPRKPIRFPPLPPPPPKGKKAKKETGSPKVSLDDVAIALGNALRASAARRGSPVQNVSGPHNAPGAGRGLDRWNRDKKGKVHNHGPEQQRELVFYARDEVNVGVSGDGGATQLTVKIRVDPGPGVFRIKKLREENVQAAFYGKPIVGKRKKRGRGGKLGGVVGGGWPETPEYVPHKTIPLGPGEGTDGWEELFSTDYRPGGTSVGVLASVAGDGWGENDFGPNHVRFDGGGLADIRGEHAQTSVYHADGFYYPKDTMLIRDGSDIELEHVGVIDADSPTQLDMRRLDPVDPREEVEALREMSPVSPQAILPLPLETLTRTSEVLQRGEQPVPHDHLTEQVLESPRMHEGAPGDPFPIDSDAGTRGGIVPNGAVLPGERGPPD